MIRIEISKKDFEKHKWEKTPIMQEVVNTKYQATIIRNGCQEEIEINGGFTLTGDTPDFYECSDFWWKTTNDLGGEWNPEFNQDSFSNGNYSIEDYVDDGIIDSVVDEANEEVSHKYYITNLPPSNMISMSHPVNMDVEHQYDGVNKEITPEIIEIMNWRNYYTPDPNGLGTKDELEFLGKVLGVQ